MRLECIGFPNAWRTNDPVMVDGYGTIPKGDIRDYPDELAAFLLATRVFAEPAALPDEPPTDDPLTKE